MRLLDALLAVVQLAPCGSAGAASARGGRLSDGNAKSSAVLLASQDRAEMYVGDDVSPDFYAWASTFFS